ncbi:hypothetical protein HYH03_008535 [Edaphochlamys debaryana]|uniref:Uncharacterized protein n=1 Tax=Edaphochlamys debaryana TaxID=47281 RepID=A0A835Y0D9_9CHLO|nr:hypothetical protein HYH03_008535 [Edaphochlamys debaryana]|eukprot:KAG2493410.1 hypothetical protein HYH03_008535 [Edaphochlamys debaryana]
MGAGASAQTQPKYKWESDHVLKGPWHFLFKERVQCACEGSKWCTRENPERQKTPNAIPGLHSSWVGDKILAMARPWQSHVDKFAMVDEFKKANIGMILNLQEVGEHATCGPGNLPGSGFTYDPEAFMKAGIGYYNFSWRDMGVPSLEVMMDIVQVMDYVTRVEGRKIAVHCHAGLGRTGLAIACYFVFTDAFPTPEEAIAATRRQRAGAVQTSKQVAFVTVFACYVQHLRCLFPAPPGGASTPTATPDSTQSGGSGKGKGEGEGKGGKSLETHSAPPAVGGGGGGGLLPSDGLVESKETGATLAGAAPPAGYGLTEEDLGLESPLPWNDSFHIEPRHLKEFKPRPPKSYTEALARQARLLHGPERRAFLRLHKLVKECVFLVMGAAQAFQAAKAGADSAHPPPRAPATPPLPTVPENQTAAGRSGAASTSAPASAPAGGADTAVKLPLTFAHALAHLLRHHSATHIDAPSLEPLAANPLYVPLTGKQVESAALLSQLASLKASLNAGRWEGLASAPLLLVLMALEALFASFATGEEPSSLTPECLQVVAKSYRDLFASQVPPPPTPTPSQASSRSGPPGSTEASLEAARQAYEILEPLAPRDSELLLVFAALMRVVARVSGPGCEEAVVEVGKWAVGLLLGRLANMAEAEEAVLSFLWYLAGRDEAFAMLVLLKRQRLAGGVKRSKGSGGSVADVKAMLAAAAASLAKATPPPSTAAPSVAGKSGGAPSEAGSQRPPPSAASGDAAAAAAAAAAAQAAYLDANSPHMQPALQLAQLLSQDIQQLYRVSFREAVAGISTVLYPPPPHTGRIEVHDVWR